MALAFQPTLRFYRLLALVGPRAARHRACSTCCSRSIPPINMRAAAAGSGRAACRPMRAAMSDRRRTALRQGPSGREFSGRLAADRSRAIARRSWRSTNSCASPTTSPTIATLQRAARSSRCSTAGSGSARQRATTTAKRCALRDAARRAQPAAAPRAGPPDRVPHGRHQAALSRLGRSDRLLQLLGHAGRPLRARRAWREPRDLAGQRRALRGAADHQSPAGLREGLSASSIASISRSMRFAAAGATSRTLGADAARRRRCCAASTTRGAHRRAAAPRARPFSGQIEDTRLALEVAVIQTLARAPRRACCSGAIR